MTYANPLDVEERIGRSLTSTELVQVQAWLDDVEAMIKARIPNLDELVTAETIPFDVIVAVECAVVIRKARNPDGKLTERIDDYSWTRDTSTASGALYLTDDEWELLTPNSSSGAFTIRPYGDPVYLAPDPWVTTT